MKAVGINHKGVDTPFTPVAMSLIDADYSTVPANSTNFKLGATGGIGNLLKRLIVVPATTAPGAITVKDGTGAAITVFTGGTVADIKPFEIELEIRSTSGAWTVTTGANVSAIAIGSFT